MTRSTRFHALLPVIATMTLAIPAVAEQDVQPTDEIDDGDIARYMFIPVFDILDCTNQGFIDRGEIDEHFPMLFNPMSGGTSRVLGRSAIVRSSDPDEAAVESALFDRMDRNADDLVSAREYRDGALNLLAAVDADGDDEITMDELMAGAPVVESPDTEEAE